MQEFDPVPELEAAGINNFHVDYDFRVVYLHPGDLAEIAGKLKPEVFLPIATAYETMFFYRGWIFTKEAQRYEHTG